MKNQEAITLAENRADLNELDLNVTEIALVHKNRFVEGFSYGDYRTGRDKDGIVYCISGTGAFIYKDETILLREGECMFLSKENGYTVRCEGDAPFIHFTVNFRMTEPKTESDSLFSRILSGKLRYVMPQNERGEPRASFERLLSDWQSKRCGYRLLTKGTLYTILYQYLTEARRETRDEGVYAVLRPARKLLDSSVSASIPTSELARLCSISEAHFRRLWKKQFGTTPTEYNRIKRLQKAKDMLLSGMYTVKATAQEVGYDDANYFSRIFRNEFGVSPTEFMK